MSEFVFKLPDLGEGTVEAEIVEWHVHPGDVVAEGDPIADVMTEKANVEVPAPVSGTVLRTSGEPGDVVPVGAELIAFETGQPAETQPIGTDPIPPPVAPEPTPPAQAKPITLAAPVPSSNGKVVTSPAIRRHAKEAGIDLTEMVGTGPRGRILRADLDAAIAGTPRAAPTATGIGAIEEVKVIGVRRVIARRMQASKREIPHCAYVEEIDITVLKSLRVRLNENRDAHQPSLTYLPFIALALIRALAEFPQCNAAFDPESGMLKRYERVYLGIAAQTTEGLKVAVVHNASARKLWDLAAETDRVTTAARDNTATRCELTGSTFTITSLGRMGGIATTPVINAPEVGIIGVNKAVKRPMVIDNVVVVRLMMNLSSCFDHRFVDGFEAASMIQCLKAYLEEPATLFID